MNLEPEKAASNTPVNILVVDDRAENRTALRAILSDPSYRLVEAGSGEEALLRLLEAEFAVLLLDVVMPGLSGFELARAIKAREKTASIPILFLTARATDVDLVYKGYRMGAVDYMVKPLVPEMVRAKVGVFADLYRERKRNEEQAARLLEAQRKENEFRLIELRLAEERRYRALADAVPHIVWTARPDGTVDYFNQRWFEYTGLSVEQAAGSWLGVVHPEDRSRSRAAWQDALGSGEMFHVECRVRRSLDGAFRWHLCRAVPERTSAGQILSWLGTFTEIEEQKRVQAMLAEFKTTLDAEPDPVIMFEPKTSTVVYANQGASTLLGYSREELLRLPPERFMAEHDEGAFREVLAPLLDGTEPHLALETKFLRKEARSSPIDVSLQLFRIGTDRIVAIARDITERKRTQFERELLYREAINAIHTRDEFLSVASHELRTPLAALQLQLQLLMKTQAGSARSGQAADPITTKLERANRQVERLTRLIGELMDVSKISAGRLQLELEEVDLGNLARDVVDRLGEESARRHSPVDCQASSGTVGKWDRMRLEQVVTNLLTNAFKFGAEKPIEVRVEDHGDSGSISIRDHGIGIAPEDVDRIFHRYEQAIASRTFGGMGLGLYIARQIVEAHYGRIRVESRLGVGSTFIVEIPKAPPEVVEGAPSSDPPEESAPMATLEE